jgi:hypothetical protein
MAKGQEIAFREPPTGDIARLSELQARRRFCIVSQSRCDRAIDSFVARLSGYTAIVDEETGKHPLEERDRKAYFKWAKVVRETVEREKDSDDRSVEMPDFVREYIRRSHVSRMQWDQAREEAEEEMERIAKRLPIWQWAKGVSGLGAKGVAVIVGEVGDFSDYSCPSKVWMRCGLGVVDGLKQGRVPSNLSAEDRKAAWKERGYNPHRRAEIWAFLDDLIIRAQWRADRDEDGKDPKKSGKPVAMPAHAIGPYGEAYGERKEYYAAKGHPAPDKAARRKVAKDVLRDMWVAWQELAPKLEREDHLPVATE